MYNLLNSAIFGPLFLILLFALCVVLVVGVKVVFYNLKNHFVKPVVVEQEVVKRKKPRTRNKKPKTPERSIEINPNEIDKIYVKKVS